MLSFILGCFVGAWISLIVVALLKSSETEYREQRERQVGNDNT